MIQEAPWRLGRGWDGVTLVSGKLKRALEPDFGSGESWCLGHHVETACLPDAGCTHEARYPWFTVTLVPLYSCRHARQR